MDADGAVTTPGTAVPEQRMAATPVPDAASGDLAALLHAVMEVPPRPARVRWGRPVICVETAAPVVEALANLDAGPVDAGDGATGSVRDLLTAAIAAWRANPRVPSAFPTFEALCRA